VSDAPLHTRNIERVVSRAMGIDARGRKHTREALHNVAAKRMIGFGPLVDWAFDTTLLAGAASLVVGTAAHVGWRVWLRLRQRGDRASTPAPTAIPMFTPVPRTFNTPV